MKTLMKRLAAICMALAMIAAALPVLGQSAYAETVYEKVKPEPPDGFVYTIYAGETGASVFVVGYEGTDTQVILPTSVTYNGVTYNAWNSETNSAGNGYYVVGTDTFSGNTKITKVAVPYGYESIEKGAFKGCTSLTEVAIADTVSYISTDIFDDCDNLTTYYMSGDQLSPESESSAVQMIIDSGLGQDAEGKPIAGVTVYTKPGSVVEKAVEEINKKADEPSKTINVVTTVTDPYKKGEENVKPESAAQTTTTTETTTTTTETTTTTSKAQKGVDGTAYGKGASESVLNAAITKYAKESDPKGTVYGLLQAELKKQTKNSLTLKWKKVKGAKKYVIYGNACGKKNKMLKQAATKKTSLTIKKINKKKVKKGTYYKFTVAAIDKNGKVISTSKMVHAVTKGSKKYCNDKSISVKKSVIKKAKGLKKGKSLKINAKPVAESKKLKVSRHRGIAYESSNTKIATVSKKGVIKAKKKGTCYIYAYAQNGKCKKIKVTVK